MHDKRVSRRFGRFLRTATVLAVGSLSAACSSDVMRFADDFSTGSTPNQDQIIRKAAATPYPSAPVQSASAYPVDPVQTGAVARSASQPVDVSPRQVTRTALPAPSGATATRTEVAAVTPPPVRTVEAPAPRPAATPAAARPSKPAGGEGWTRAGGTHVQLRQGETIYNLAKRYGVPANAILEANDLSRAEDAKAGQDILIPTYVYGRTAKVSAPDNSAQVAAASSGTGVDRSVPTPKRAPENKGDELAMLPQAPAQKPRGSSSAGDAAADASPKKPAAKPDGGVKGGRYVVQPGDSLWTVSKKTGASVEALRQTNAISGDNIRVGQSLVVPGLSDGSGVVVAKASKSTAVDPIVTGTPTKQAQSKQSQSPSIEVVEDKRKAPAYTPPKEASITKVAAKPADAEDDAGGKLRWPVKGKVVTAFGDNSSGRRNDGIDISVPEGTPVKAAEGGVVIYAGEGLKELGRTVLVRHDNGLVTVYGHNSDLQVKRGQKVKRGEVIAASGRTGDAAAPKLHFEVRKDSAPINPKTFLN